MSSDYLATALSALSQAPTRRDVLRGLAAAGLGLATAQPFQLAETKKRRKRKKRKQRTPPATPNAYGCLNVDDPCTSANHCCSGICLGKKGKKTCQAHDTGDCAAGHDAFGDETISCQTSSGTWGKCGTTTGNAGYCMGNGECHPCAKDADCQALCGPQAACVVSPAGCSVVTVCAVPNNAVCPP